MAKKKTSKKTNKTEQPVTRKPRPRFLRGWILLWAAVIVFVAYNWFNEQDFFAESCEVPAAYQIVFDRSEDDITDLYWINGTGSLKNLTNSPELDSNPVWSPDGQLVAFDSRAADGTWDIFTVDTEGNDSRKLTVLNWDYSPEWEWSPDSQRIVYAMRDKTENRRYMQIVNVADGEVMPVLEYTGGSAPVWAWSPDGHQIAFEQPQDDARTLSVMDVESGESVVLSEKTGTAADQSFWSSWSPDGERIAFTMADSNGNQNIVTANPDGSDQQQLTDGVDNSHPVWSPDGGKIVYSSGNNLYVLDSGGGDPVRLTYTNMSNSFVGWSPSGEQILFRAQSDKDDYLYVVDNNGDHPKRLDDSLKYVSSVSWSPDSRYVFFADSYSSLFSRGKMGLYFADAVSGHKTTLTENVDSWNFAPVFSPDGYYIGYRAKNKSLYLMNLHTNSRCKLTEIGVRFDWRPELTDS